MIRRGAIARLLGAAAVLAAGARPADAYVRTVTAKNVALRWSSDCVTLNIHRANPAMNLTPDLFQSAATAAASAWSRPVRTCTNLLITVNPVDDDSAPVGNDKQNNLLFRKTEWCKEPHDPTEPCYDHKALAITTVFAEQTTGRIVDTDIEVNGVDFTWGDLVGNVGTGGGAQDVQNTLTHEFGHMIGLDHNCYLPGQDHIQIDNTGRPVPACSAASSEEMRATMFAAVIKFDIERRTLSADDIQGVCDVYPARTDGPSCQAAVPVPGGGDGGGCAVVTPAGERPTPSRAGLFGACAALATVLTLRRRRRHRR